MRVQVRPLNNEKYLYSLYKLNIREQNMEVCNKCGLPSDLCICEDLAKENQKIRVFTNTRRFKKITTIIEGIDTKNVNIKELSQKLKTKFACGGTIKEGRIELQGDHREEVKKLLVSYGFSPNLIELKM